MRSVTPRNTARHLWQLSLIGILLITSSATTVLASQSKQPDTPIADSDTQLYIGHGSQLTARIPSDWSPDRSLTYDYRHRTRFIASVPFGTYPFESLAQVCAAVATDERYAREGHIHSTTWRGQAACIVRTSEDTPYDPVSLVFAHPGPASDGHNTFVAVTTDGAHFDAIVASIAFDPSIVTPTAYLDAALDIIETRSLWRDRIDWPEVRAAAHAYINDDAISDSPWLTGVYDAIPYVLDEIRQAGGDVHHAFMPPPADAALGTPGPSRPYIAPTGMPLDPGIGYVALPGVGTGGQTERYVAETRAILGTMQPETTCGWIVDLRGDTGGNMYAMVGGLASLFPPGLLLAFRDVAGEDTAVTLTGDGVLEHDGIPIEWMPPLSDADNDMVEQPVAVLIGPATASAGEGTTLALVHRDGTRFFGEGTAGVATAPTGFSLFDGAVIVLATVWMSGPHGAIYPDGIEPDVVISPSDTVQPLSDDLVVQAAAEWLGHQPGCETDGAVEASWRAFG